MFDYINLEALYWVSNTGSFEKAGKKLCISQSAVTQRVRKLEENQGQILLKRSSPPELTSRGILLVEHFKKVMLLESDIESYSSSEITITLGVNSDSLYSWFPDVISSYLKEGKNRLEIITADQDKTKELLDSGRVMGCISSFNGKIRGCNKYYLGEMEYRLVCTERYYNQYFKEGFNFKSFNMCPRLDFNRDDNLINNWVQETFDKVLTTESHYVPSSDLFPRLILNGEVCGFLDDFSYQKSDHDFIDLTNNKPVKVPLYLYIWNVNSRELKTITRIILDHKRDGEEV